MNDLDARIAKLEKENRMLKRVGLVGAVAVACIVLMGQASKKTIEANEFVLKDDAGQVRARLAMSKDPTAGPGFPNAPQLFFYNKSSGRTLVLNGDEQFPGLSLYDPKDQARFIATLTLFGGSLLMTDDKGTLKTRLREGDMSTTGEIAAPTFDVIDGEGFESVLGVTNLVTPRTGEKHTSSAASLVMFDKEKKVIWKAP